MTDTRVIRHTLPCGCSWGAFKSATYCQSGTDLVEGLWQAARDATRTDDWSAIDYANALADWRGHFGSRRPPEDCRRHRSS